MAGKGKVVDAEVLEAEGDDLDPTELRQLFFRPMELADEKLQEVEKDLKTLFKDSEDTRGELDNLLAHWNDLAEGISPPKNFPWQDSCNIHVPIAETKLNELHSGSRQTLLRTDQVYTVESVGDPLSPQQVAKAEQYLNYKVTRHLSLTGKFSEIVWAAGRDGTVIANVYYCEEYKTLPAIKTYKGLQEFMGAYPPDAISDSGLSKAQYQKVLDKFAKGAKAIRLLEEEEVCTYRGPRVDVVELQDFRMSPMTAIKTSHARLVGKIFTLRAPEIRAMAELEGWDEDAVERVIASTDMGRNDTGSQLKNEIEGIAKSHLDKQKNGEFVLFNGLYRADLNDDGKEETYLVFFHYLSGTLLGGVHYPYVHGHDNFIPVRIKKRPNRFLGRGLCQMLDDINLEINTQHRQRIDSRTITTVPSFKVKQSERQNFDPSRPDKRFFPGVAFYLTDINAVEQFKLEQTDMSETLQEESNLMALVDRQVGSMTPNGGSREAAAKVRMMVSLADARMDDYFEEIAGNGEEGEGLDEVGYQILSILHQFASDKEVFPLFADPGSTLAPATQTGVTPAAPAAPTPGGVPLPGGASGLAPGSTPADGSAGPLAVPGNVPMQPLPEQGAQEYKQTITAEELDLMQRRVKVKLAKTSTAMNPDNALMRWTQIYSLLVMDPLVGGNPKGRLALDRRLLELARVPNAEQYLPPDPKTAAEWMQLQQVIMQSMMARKGGRPGARTRGQGKQPSAGGMATGQGGGPK